MVKKAQEIDEELDVEVESEEDEVALTYDIATYPSDNTLSVWYEMWRAGDIVIPDFQRNFVWNIRQSSLLIESFLLGLPVPQVFVYIDDENKSMVIDGQQRLSSVAYYFEGFFGSESIQGSRQVFRLQGLDPKSPYSKKSYSELSESDQRKLRLAVLRAINIRQIQPKGEPTSAYHIFERLNTGGTPLKPQEIRNCVFRGDFVGILRNLNGLESWRQIVGKSTLDKHQKDVELILRIFSLTYYFNAYEKPMKEFMNIAMNAERSGTSANVKNFLNDFPAAAKDIIGTLGERPFHLRGRLNSSALDSIFATLIWHLGKWPNDLTNRFARLKEDKEFTESTILSTSDTAVIKRRFALVEKYLITR